MNLNTLKERLVRMNKKKLIMWCMNMRLLHNEKICIYCENHMNYVPYTCNYDENSWR
ncbi:hypothetical protein GVAV_001849, partial [Gurleya vavrai]